MKRKFPLIALFCLASLGGLGWQAKSWWQTNSAPVASAKAAKVQIITIPNGTPTQEIGQILAQGGVIRSAKAWQLWNRWQSFQKKSGGPQAGTYSLSTGESLPQVAQKLWTGEVVTKSFTIPEGWSIRQMAVYFEQQGYFPAQDFIAATRSIPTQQYPWLPTNVVHLEGFLYPDTYQLIASEKVTPQQVVKQMLDRFAQLALPIYQKKPNGMSLLQWVTLGSIVEKEAVVAKERPLIAGVFTNRLKQGIALGSDPTVEYGLGIQQTKEQPLTLAQVNMPSPYNTYMNPGLPPGPIASPGVASLDATLNPSSTDYLYFMARYDGTHIFSKTLGEHESAQNGVRDKVEAEMATEAAKPDSAKPVPPNSTPTSPSPLPN
jgi:UPF0755 protein